MDKPKRVGDAPLVVELKEGKTYAWCACGRSKNQPFCDGSHSVTSIKPKMFTVEKDGTYYACMCKNTKNQPFCDGSHKQE